jgi:hypothetical protein
VRRPEDLACLRRRHAAFTPARPRQCESLRNLPMSILRVPIFRARDRVAFDIDLQHGIDEVALADMGKRGQKQVVLTGRRDVRYENH